jgi:hypothetical protein
MDINFFLAPTSYLFFKYNIYATHIILVSNEIIFIYIYLILYMMNISGELIIGLSSIFCTGVLGALAHVFKIKCIEMSVCYCFKCKRDVR